MIDVDIDTLETLLSDELSYTHSTGQLESKAQFLESLRSETIRYLSIEPTDIQVRLYGDTGVVTTITAVRVRVGGQDLEALLRMTEVHRKDDSGWHLVAYQSTRMPEQQ
jgi:ketosteroid isomerase-like protein